MTNLIEALVSLTLIEMTTCPKCKGSGKRFKFFTCRHCYGFKVVPKGEFNGR